MARERQGSTTNTVANAASTNVAASAENSEGKWQLIAMIKNQKIGTDKS